MMYDKLRLGKYSGAIAIFFTFLSLNSSILNAQENPSEYRFLQDIEAGTNTSWNFTSEDESRSVRDEIKELGDYSLSDSDAEVDVRLVEEERRWGNWGNVEDYSIQTEFYEY